MNNQKKKKKKKNKKKNKKHKKKKKDESFNKSHLLIDIIFASDNHLCFRTIPLEKLQKLILRN